MTGLDLPGADGALRSYELRGPGSWTKPTQPITSRVAYAAAHVVPLPLADNTPGAPATLDWDATLAYRHELWSYGLGVADAMDTAQRGMGLDWAATAELIKRSGAEAAAVGGRLACGAGTDQLDLDALPPGPAGLDAVLGAYREQADLVLGSGATVIVMASRALARVARTAEDYRYVYSALLSELPGPAILHWLGPMFDPALAGYWGSADPVAATETFVELVAAHASQVDGVKVSLLDARHEIGLRDRLAAVAPGVRLYTGDDFNYPELIHGDGEHHSDALLGIFAAIYPAASTALQAYDAGDGAGGRAVLETTQELGRHIFGAPTPYYKVGVAFLSWLNGHQGGFNMVGGLESSRSVPHLVRTFELADAAGLLLDPELAVRRMAGYLAVHGVGGLSVDADRRLSLNTATVKALTLTEALDVAARAGLEHVGLWRDRVAEVGLERAVELVRRSGLAVSTLCRGGFLTASDPSGIAAALEDNRAAVREAAALGTAELILVVGGLPPGDRDLVAARARVANRIAELAPYAADHGVRLVLEPLHPMYAADRAVVSTLAQALDLAAPHDPATVGVVIDTFHVWWDPQLAEQVARAGRDHRIASYQVCDFNLPIAADPLLSRGYMGDGVVDFASISRWVTAAGYDGVVEVEIFNAEIWDSPADEVVATVAQRFADLVAPFLPANAPSDLTADPRPFSRSW